MTTETTRRKFAALAAGATAFSFARSQFAQAQTPSYRLGFLSGRNRDADFIQAFLDELRLFGVAEGQNLMVLPDGFNRQNDQFPEAAAALAKASPDVVVASGDLAARAMQNATHTIPIVANSDDMIAAGFVRSLSRPDGNMTGISLLATELDGKRLEILMEAAPEARHIATLSDTHLNTKMFQAMQDAVRARGIELTNFAVASPDGIASAVVSAKASGATAVNVLATSLFGFNRRRIIDAANAARLPAIYQWPEMAEDGGLLGYGPRLTVIYRQIARQAVKVLRGVKPADLPVEQPTTFELVVNLKTAKTIGVQIPEGLLARADKLIEWRPE